MTRAKNHWLPLLVAAVLVARVGGGAAAADDVSPRDEALLEQAFQLGFAGAPARLPAPVLDVESRQRTTIISGRAGDQRLELVCLLCDGDEVLATARSIGAQLAALAGGAKPGRLQLAGLAPGDRALVDGVPVGGGEALVEPGNHRVVVIQANERREGSVELAPGAEARLAVDQLSPLPHPRPFLRASIVIGGLGLAAGAVAAALLVIADDCASTRVDQDGDCAELHDTAPAGWTFAGLGGGALIAALVLLLIEGDPETEEPGPLAVAEVRR